MTSALREPSRPARVRRHGPVLHPAARRQLERAGWRTTLEFRENHVRGLDGRLLRTEQVWTAEAERDDGAVVVASALGATQEEAWVRLLADVQAANVDVLRPAQMTPTGRARTSTVTAGPAARGRGRP